MHRVIKATPAKDDIDHVHMVVDNNPKVPSRIKALIEKTGESPLPALQAMAQKLQAWGVDFIAMPCNTAHFFHQDIQKVIQIPLLNMVDLAVNNIISQESTLRTAGIIASTAVLELELYKQPFADNNIQLISPDRHVQQEVMHAIRIIKHGQVNEQVQNNLQLAVDNLIHKGAEVLLIACTEISIVTTSLKIPVQYFDSAQILAETIVKTAKAN